MIFPGAPSALRGYRLQHLYSLYRILSDDEPASHSFQLEGTEDLEVYDFAGKLIEAIQVKARSSAPLAPSALGTSKGESFFRRAAERLELHPASRQRVVSFGSIGPGLQALGTPGTAATDEQRETLEQLGVPSGRVESFRAAFDVEEVNEADIEREVLDRLNETITGGNAGVAFLYLSGWMYLAMEERRRLTAADVRERMLAVGRFTAEAQAHAAEWFTTIVPIEERPVDDTRRELLVRDFYEGVSARFEHILAGVDVERRERVAEIEAAFGRSNVVIVHGASGQGKTALAWRYLMTADPAAWRFSVRELQDIPHARRVALALRSHADAIGVPMIVWFDVAPQDTAWTQVVEDLETLPNTRLLVTIREEDWTRARNAGATLQNADVALALDESEGRAIFDGLQRYRTSAEFLDFNDAWLRFGGHGPLMEFTYLVTRNSTLETKLEQQIRRLRDDVRLGQMSPNEIELLRRIAVATAAGGRVRLRKIVADLALADAKTSLERFKREYLLRVSPDGLHAEGLHPLRSTTVARLLTSDAAFDPSWLDTAIAVLPAIEEAHLESFLLSLFTQPLDHDRLKTALMSFRPQTWSGGTGVVRTLLWRGMHEYTTEHAELIAEVVERKQGSEFALAVLDPAGLQTFSPSFAKQIEGIFSFTPELRDWCDDIQARKPSNDYVMRDAFRWLRDAPQFTSPASPSDWRGMAEVLFWMSASGFASSARAAMAVDVLAQHASDASLDAAADVVFALSFWEEALLPKNVEAVRDSLIGRFRVEMRVFAIERDDDGTIAHYVVSLEQSENLHEETLRRLDLMRCFMPSETAFSAQAHGHIFGSDLFQHDPSKKRGVPAHTFAIPWAVRLHRLFAFVARVRMRGLSWGAYAETIFKMRQTVVMLAEITTDSLRKYFSRDKPKNIFEIGVDKEAWVGMSFALNDLPRLPASSVDAWGFELRQNPDVRTVQPRSEHAEWEEALRKYARSLYDFLETSTPHFLANCHLGRPTAGNQEVVARALEDTNYPAHAATTHLAVAIEWLPALQKEFRSRFARFTDSTVLARLEAEEHERLWTLWNVWFQFADRPRQYFGDARREALAEAASLLKRRVAELTRRLGLINDARVSVHQERGPSKEGQGLWLTMDVEESGDIEIARDATLAQMTEALRPPPDFHAFDRYVLDLVWRHVHVVPLVRGKSLAGTAWSFRIVALPPPGESFEAWQLLERPVDQGTWKELCLDTWPMTLGGPPRHLQAELLAVSVLIDLLLRLENAPDPDAQGRLIFVEHWNQSRKTIVEHARNAAVAAAQVPALLFSNSDVLNILRTWCEQIATDVESLEPFAYDALRTVSTRINEFVSGTLTIIVHTSIHNDLSADT